MPGGEIRAFVTDSNNVAMLMFARRPNRKDRGLG